MIITQAVLIAAIKPIFMKVLPTLIKKKLILQTGQPDYFQLPKHGPKLWLHGFLWSWKVFCREENHDLMIHNRREHQYALTFIVNSAWGSYWTILSHLFDCGQSSRWCCLCWKEGCLILWCFHSYNTKNKFIFKSL